MLTLRVSGHKPTTATTPLLPPPPPPPPCRYCRRRRRRTPTPQCPLALDLHSPRHLPCNRLGHETSLVLTAMRG